ncbi:putative ABC transport system permease protein [Parelusimicrobium proximum]|uniref:ABC transporter permease n=1 Tax=Parelusimicrobium proximum TaxID=3228953 RepID=UPI003D179CE9
MFDFTTIKTIISISSKAIWANKMRSALTSLGIIIGVAAVIAMIAIGSGTQKDISERIGKMGTNTMSLQAGSASGGGFSFDTTRVKYLTTDDAKAIAEEIHLAQYVYPSITTSRNIVSGNSGTIVRIMGTTNTIFDVQPWSVGTGRTFSDADMASGSNVCIIGSESAKELFADLDPVDRSVRIEGILYTIIGVLDPVGEGSWGFDPDNGLIVPITNMQTKMGMAANRPKYTASITIKVENFEDMDAVQLDVIRLMRQRHKLTARQDNDFYINNLAQMLETMKSVATTLSLLLGAIASISLLVGGIGIMNIMLVSVTERTREIGIRMAIGAGVWDIRLQFLTEAVILSLFGGIVGILFGVGIAELVHYFSGMTIQFTVSSIVLAFSVSAFIGISFGFYPAYKASNLNPIDALRYE